jgi:hypothetical protein
MVVSTVPNKEDSMMLIKKTKEFNKKAIMIVTAMNVDDALSLYKTGADYVILPHFLGGERVSLILEEAEQNAKKLLKAKQSHMKELEERIKLKHKHPIHSHRR